MTPQTDQSLSIYLHIPFCTTKCTYCAFNTYTNQEKLIPAFVQSLADEAAYVARQNPYSSVHTIFLGGGTPSLLTAKQFNTILSSLKDHFTISSDVEITIETNPNDLDTIYLKSLRELGINRLSIGMQTSNMGELTLFARRHDHAAVIKAFKAAREAGFDNINLDIIYGAPYQTIETWQQTLDDVFTLQPEHVSLYALGLEEETPLLDWVETGRVPTPDDDLAADMYELATITMVKNGYEQYEISNWSKPGYACRHNLQYWYNLPYIGLGPGAHGFAGGVRYDTILSPQRYIKAIQQHPDQSLVFPRTPATNNAIQVDQKNEIAETLIMTLRLTQEGVDRQIFEKRFGIDLLDLHRATLERFAGYDLLEIKPDVIRLTEKGRLLSNTIFRELV